MMKNVQCHYHPLLVCARVPVRRTRNGCARDDMPTTKSVALVFVFSSAQHFCAKFLSIAFAGCRMSMRSWEKKHNDFRLHTGTQRPLHGGDESLVFRCVRFYRTNYPKNDLYMFWERETFSVNTKLCVKFPSAEMAHTHVTKYWRELRRTSCVDELKTMPNIVIGCFVPSIFWGTAWTV